MKHKDVEMITIHLITVVGDLDMEVVSNETRKFHIAVSAGGCCILQHFYSAILSSQRDGVGIFRG